MRGGDGSKVLNAVASENHRVCNVLFRQAHTCSEKVVVSVSKRFIGRKVNDEEHF